MVRLAGVIAAALCGCGGMTGASGDDMPDAGLPLVDGSIAADATDGAPTAAELLAKLAACGRVVGGPFAPNSGDAATISVCGLTGAVFWKADMDIDCDGKMSAECNIMADPDYANQTAATDSHGGPLDAAALPYVVIPGKSSRLDYVTAGLAMGSVVAVIYNTKVVYAVLGDIGPTSIIGEASYATAAALGIDPDPSTGGVDSGVAYIAFTGSGAIVDPIEDHAAAVQLGIAHAKAL